MSEKLWELNKIMNEKSLHDDIYTEFAEDHDGNLYVIFDSWDDQEKFLKVAKEELGLDDDLHDYQVEKELNAEFVFGDEYTTCSDCNHIIRTSPDGYGWQPNFYVGDGFIVCDSCFANNVDYQVDYLQDKINNPKTAINGLISEEQLENMGFEKLNSDSYESGLHHGQNDNPTDIYNELSERYAEVLFMVDGVGQFDVHFSVWVNGEFENEEE